LFLKIAETSQLLEYFFHCQGYALFWTKVYWATFWAIFSQTHLVTLNLNPSCLPAFAGFPSLQTDNQSEIING
jgi:hypothetical protein